MRVRVGSKNEVKIEAVREALALYEMFDGAEVEGVAASSDVSEQPKSLEETVRGAQNRARSAFEGCDYAVGLESGLVAVPGSKAGYVDMCCCAIFDGSDMHLGFSPAFEPPAGITKLVFEEGHDLSSASKEIGLTTSDEIGKEEGLIGIVTKGAINRKEYTRQAVIMAIAHLNYGEA